MCDLAFLLAPRARNQAPYVRQPRRATSCISAELKHGDIRHGSAHKGDASSACPSEDFDSFFYKADDTRGLFANNILSVSKLARVYSTLQFSKPASGMPKVLLPHDSCGYLRVHACFAVKLGVADLSSKTRCKINPKGRRTVYADPASHARTQRTAAGGKKRKWRKFLGGSPQGKATRRFRVRKSDDHVFLSSFSFRCSNTTRTRSYARWTRGRETLSSGYERIRRGTRR